MTTTINDLLNLPNDAKISNADYCLFGQYLISMSGTYLMLTDKTGFHRSIRFGLAHKRTRPITLVFLEEIFAQGCVPLGLLEAVFDSCETKIRRKYALSVLQIQLDNHFGRTPAICSRAASAAETCLHCQTVRIESPPCSPKGSRVFFSVTDKFILIFWIVCVYNRCRTKKVFCKTIKFYHYGNKKRINK